MGSLRFFAPGQAETLKQIAPRCYMAGLEGIPWHTRATATGEMLLVERETSESGTLVVPWQVPGHGELMLATSNLMETDDPYLLPLELARGTVNRLRGQASAWQLAGLVIDAALAERITASTQQIARAAVNRQRGGVCLDYCELAIATALEAIDSLVRAYGEQVLDMRRQAGPLNTLIAATLQKKPLEKPAKVYQEAFNAIVVPMTWSRIEPQEGELDHEEYDDLIEWARTQNLKICGGPLVAFDRRSLPVWLTLYEDEPEEVRALMLRHVSFVVNRYRGKVHLWNVAARVNVDGAIRMEEEEMLRLTVECIEAVRAADPRTPIVVSFDQPWSEHLGVQDRDLPPLNFADTLARANLGVSGFGLEINWGYCPHGTPMRDAVELSRLIDRWSMLGLPLMLQIAAPSSGSRDPFAKSDNFAVTDPSRKRPDLHSQAEFIERYLPVCIAKHSVQAVAWNAWCDAEPHEFPYNGLLDVKEKLKPAVSTLAKLRKKYLH